MTARLGLRAKLFLVSTIIIALSAVGAYVLLGEHLEALTRARLHDEARARAGLVQLEVSHQSPPLSLDDDTADRVADDLGATGSGRITIFDRAGVAVGDSTLDISTLRDLAAPSESAETRRALAGEDASATRFSSTSHETMVFAAVPLRAGDQVVGAVRVGASLEPVRQVRSAVARLVGLGSGIALLLAFVLSSLAAGLASQGVRELATQARRMAGGELDARARPVEGEHLVDLGRSLEQLAEGLRTTLSELVGQRDVLSGVLTSMREGVLLVDREGRVALLNAALREMLLITDDADGKLPIEVIRDTALHDLLDSARRTQRAVQGEIEVSGLKPRMLLVRAELLHVQPGGLLVVFHDVTDLRRLESLRRDFVANASHELRTPVTAIRSAAETLGAIPPEDVAASHRFLAIVERNAERLQHLIDDLLDLSKIESRELALSAEPTDVAEVAEHVVALLSERAARSKTTIRIRFPSDLPRARADARALEQVLQNLLDNAIKYCPNASVLVSGARKDDRIVVYVSDRGPGIEAKHLDRLFERFYRVDAGRSRQLGGTGLGLSIVKHLLEAMNGSIDVKSEVGEGTTFTITLEMPSLEPASISTPTPGPYRPEAEEPHG